MASETIGELWMAANRSMFGDSLEFTEGYALWWSYIPHFIHSPFYVYAYSYGQLLVLALLGRYEAEGEDFVPKYLDLLAAGNSDSPDALLSRMDLDVTDPNFWDLGLSVLDKMVGEAEALGAGPVTLVELDFVVTGKPSDPVNNPAPTIKINFIELKGSLGESFRWFNEVGKANGTITILEAAACNGGTMEGEGEGEGEVPTQPCHSEPTKRRRRIAHRPHPSSITVRGSRVILRTCDLLKCLPT